MDSQTLSKTSASEVVVHPLVLLSVGDHYNRLTVKTHDSRVVGALLGTRTGSTVDITNSFAVPFEEDPTNPDVWFLDHTYLSTMLWLFKRINNNDELVGFYSSGPKVRESDLKIANVLRGLCEHEPVFVVIDVRPGISELPTTAYESVKEVEAEGKEIKRVFQHLACRIEADDVEEVGVEHLLRDVRDPTSSHMSTQVLQLTSSMRSLEGKLNQEISKYLQLVASGRLPVNNTIIYHIQDILNLLPNLNSTGFVDSLMAQTNDNYVAMYIGAIVRSIVALHDLLNNKLEYNNSNSKDNSNKLSKEADKEKEKDASKPN